jgi:hypothetical protein
MKRILLLMLLFCVQVHAQEKFQLLSTIQGSWDFFSTDNQGNIYAVKDDELIKFSRKGKELYRYSNKQLGKISAVDAGNMMRVIVFYREFSQVVFLDNTLSVNGEPLSFDKLGFQQVNLVASSFNNGLWIYDQQNSSLLQLSSEYQVAQQTQNLNALLNTELQPVSMVEYDNRVYLNDPESGILVFDIYGTYYKTVPAKKATFFQPLRDWVYYLKEGRIAAYNLKTTEETSFDLPASEALSFRLEVETLVVQTASAIEVYTSR